MDNVKLSPPWEVFRRKVEALFAPDPSITTRWDENARDLIITCATVDKAEAIDALLGGVKDGCTVRVQTGEQPNTTIDLIRRAFDGNKAFVDVMQTGGAFPMQFAIFEPRAAQFWADNLGDPWGNYTMLYADLAKDVFEDMEVRFTSNKLEAGAK